MYPKLEEIEARLKELTKQIEEKNQKVMLMQSIIIKLEQEKKVLV